MTTLDLAKLAELRRLEAAATPGPWLIDEALVLGVSAPGRAVCAIRALPAKPEHYADAGFIAATRNALPELLVALDRLAALSLAWRRYQQGELSREEFEGTVAERCE